MVVAGSNLLRAKTERHLRERTMSGGRAKGDGAVPRRKMLLNHKMIWEEGQVRAEAPNISRSRTCLGLCERGPNAAADREGALVVWTRSYPRRSVCVFQPS